MCIRDSSIRDPDERRRSQRFFGEKLMVAMPDLLPLMPSHAVWVPHPVDTEVFFPKPERRTGVVEVGFYEPTNEWGRVVNTPDNTRQAIRKLGREDVRDRSARDLPWSEMPEYFNRLDIWIDKMNLNFYGVSACEAAACGVPVIAHLGENEKSLVPDCPFLEASYANLGEVIDYLTDENTRKYVGRKCLDFVKRVHEAGQVCDLVSAVYDSA